MTDPIIPVAAAPSAPPVIAAVTQGPPATASPPEPAAATIPVEAKAVEVAPVVEPAKPAEPTSADKPSMLEAFDKEQKAAEPAKEPVKDEKPAEPAKPEDPAKIEAKPEGEPPKEAEPVTYKFELPEGFDSDDARMTALSGALNEAKLPAEVGQALGQKLVGLHSDAMKAYADQVKETTSREQHRVFNETRGEWNKQAMADEEIGGSAHQTAMRAIARARDKLAGDLMSPRKNADGSVRLSELEEFLRVTGAGDHPVFLKMLHRAARYVDEPQAETIPQNIKPPKNNGRAPKGGIYTHPSSQNMER